MKGPWGRHKMNGKWVLKHGSPFGNKMKPLPSDADNYFQCTFHDNQLKDGKGKFIDTKDSVDFEAKFSDPQGNTYEISIFKVMKPPIPGWETQGGVLMNSDLAGDTGTFIPLIPRSYSYATFWAIGRISINGKKPIPRVVVLYITEDIRDADGNLALDEEMPIGSDGVQAHLLVPPIKPVPGKGPVPAPVPTKFKLPPKAPKKFQPFICVYFPNPQITEGTQHVK